jgi:isopentenyl diphosphate isomerase/L-lactate dehydrogenase-like FMN-dependent dehydrogenase
MTSGGVEDASVCVHARPSLAKFLTPMVRPLLDLPSQRRLAACVNIADLRDAAKLRAHKMVFDYLDAGADDEITIRRNKDAYSQLELHYHILAGLKPPLNMGTRIMGREVDIPFFPAPTAGSKMFHADGEVGVAQAAAAHGAMYCLSTMGTTAPREVGPATPGHPKLFQLYVWKDRGLVRDMLAQAREEGFHALALTVDLTWYGNRERDVRNGFTVPPAYTARQTLEAIKRPAWLWDFLANPEYAYAAVELAAEGRRRRAEERRESSGGGSRYGGASPTGKQSWDSEEAGGESKECEAAFPTDRRAQVAFIRDAFDPSFDWSDAEWLCQEWGDTGPVVGLCKFANPVDP